VLHHAAEEVEAELREARRAVVALEEVLLALEVMQ